MADMCKGHPARDCKNPAAEPHTCPYDEELAPEDKPLALCKCCDECKAECHADI